MATMPLPQPTGNPLLDNPALKAQLAAQMAQQAQPQPQGAVMPPAGAAPPPQISMPTSKRPDGLPELNPAAMPAGPRPQVKAPLGTSAGDQAELSRKLQTGSGISQIAGKIENSGLGQAHPVLGKILGIGAQGLAQLGDIGLTTLGGGLGQLAAQNIPGTQEHHNIQVHQDQHQVAQDIGNEEKQAQTQDIQSQIPLRQAQTEEAQTRTANVPAELERQNKVADAQIANLLHPQAKTEFEAWRQQNPDAPVEDWLKAQQENKAPKGTKEQLQAGLIAAQNSGDTATAHKIQQQLKDIDPMGEQRITIQQQNAANTQSKARDATTEKEYTYTRGKWDKELGTYNSQNTKLSEASQLVGSGAMGAALGAVKALSGLAGGQGSGVRITQAELNSIAHARGFKGDFDAYLQQFGDGNKLTPQQVQALKGIISDVQHVASVKEQVINKGLDDLSEATDSKTIRKIDSQLRHALMGGNE
jgi:hypothetical protein